VEAINYYLSSITILIQSIVVKFIPDLLLNLVMANLKTVVAKKELHRDKAIKILVGSSYMDSEDTIKDIIVSFITITIREVKDLVPSSDIKLFADKD
jgi:uncharacterized metal-binding protein